MKRGYLAGLVGRASGTAPLLRPSTPTRFEPDSSRLPGLHAASGFELDVEVEAPSTATHGRATAVNAASEGLAAAPGAPATRERPGAPAPDRAGVRITAASDPLRPAIVELHETLLGEAGLGRVPPPSAERGDAGLDSPAEPSFSLRAAALAPAETDGVAGLSWRAASLGDSVPVRHAGFEAAATVPGLARAGLDGRADAPLALEGALDALFARPLAAQDPLGARRSGQDTVALPAVHVHIGRVEVRAVAAVPTSVPTPARRSTLPARPSLEEQLLARDKGER